VEVIELRKSSWGGGGHQQFTLVPYARGFRNVGKETHYIEGDERRIGGRNKIFDFENQIGGIPNRNVPKVYSACSML